MPFLYQHQSTSQFLLLTSSYFRFLRKTAVRVLLRRSTARWAPEAFLMAADLQLAWPWAAVACGLEHVGEAQR